MVIAWIVLIASGLLEVVWATFLKRADGFRHKRWLGLGIALELVSVTMLGWAIQSVSLGVGYAAWAGIGTLGTILVGLVAFGERLTARRAFFLGLLIAGIIGLQLVT